MMMMNWINPKAALTAATVAALTAMTSCREGGYDAAYRKSVRIEAFAVELSQISMDECVNRATEAYSQAKEQFLAEGYTDTVNCGEGEVPLVICGMGDDCCTMRPAGKIAKDDFYGTDVEYYTDFVTMVKLCGTSTKMEYPVWSCQTEGIYDEGNGYTARFSTVGEVKYDWSTTSSDGKVVFEIYGTGGFEMRTYYEDTSLDVCTLTLSSEGTYSTISSD